MAKVRRLAGEQRRWSWSKVKRWLCGPDCSWNTITAPGAPLFDLTKVRIERYWDRGTEIPTPYDPGMVA